MTLLGLALFYAGLVQSKNVLSVMMHCFAIACLVSVLWLAGAWRSATAVVTGLRVSDEEITDGLDVTAHCESGYSL